MNNVIRTAKLDFTLIKPYWWNLLFIMLFPVVFSIMNKSLINGVSFTMCFMGISASYPFSISEKNGMERLYGVLPIPKRDMVLGRYLYICVMGLSALAFSLVLCSIVLQKLTGVYVTLEDVITAALTGIIIYTIYIVFLLPGYYKFGAIKGRFIMLIPVGTYLLIWWLLSRINVETLPVYFGVFDNPVIIISSVVLFCIIAFLISVLVSIKIFQNKEV